MPPTLITENEFRSSRYGEIDIPGRLGDLITNAEDAIEKRLQRTIAPKDYTELWQPTTNTLYVRNRPIISLTSIKRRRSFMNEWQTLDTIAFRIASGPGYIESLYHQMAGYDVEVIYRAGFSPTPGAIKEAVILQTVLLSYQDVEVYGGGDGKEPGLAYIDPQIERLIKPFHQSPLVWH